MMCLLDLNDIRSDDIQLNTMSKVVSRIDAMKKRKFVYRNHGQMPKLGLNILKLFSFILSLFYNIQRFLLFFILIFLIFYLCSNLMMLLFRLVMAIQLIFSKFTCFLLKIIRNLIKNLQLREKRFHQNFELNFNNLLDKVKARFINRFFHLIKCIPKL